MKIFQRKGLFLVGFALFSIFVLIATMTTRPTFGSENVEQQSADPEYDYAVINLEPVSVVRARVEKAVGDRFVEIWITPDQKSYVVGIYNLKAGEKKSLEKEVQGIAPVQLVNRDVSRVELEKLGAEIEKLVEAQGIPISSFGLDYEAGAVLVGLETVKPSDVMEQLNKEMKLQGKVHLGSDGHSMRDGAARFEPGGARVIVFNDALTPEESPTASPFRAGKRLTIGSSGWCTAGYTVTKNGMRYGLTAGHCGVNGTSVTFAGVRQGNIQNNSLYAANPANSDAAVFKLNSSSMVFLYRSSTINRKVSGLYASAELVKNLRVCTRGSKTGDQSCGPITQTRIQTVYSGSGKRVNNGWRWRWDPNGTQGGDSGAPVYRVQADGSVKAAGIHRAGDGSSTSVFTSIKIVLSDTGSSLLTTQ